MMYSETDILSRAISPRFPGRDRNMSAKNTLLIAPPYPVEQAIQRLGANLRTARLRRNLTIAEVAQKIGTGPRAVMAAEKGKPSTAFAIYAALLWAYDLLGPLTDIAEPAIDAVGQSLSLANDRSRARRKAGLDNDF